MHLTTEFWHFFFFQFYWPTICAVWWCLCLFLLCMLCPPCGAAPWGLVRLGGATLLNYGWRWRRDEGWPRGDMPPSIPNTSDSHPTPPPCSLFPPASLSAQAVTIHAWREVWWGWLEMCLSLSLSVFLLCCFSFTLVTRLSLSLSLFLSIPDFFWESQNNRGPFSWNWSADVEKTRQRLTVSWFSSSVKYQQYSAGVESASIGFCLIISSSQHLENVLWGFINRYTV